MHESQKLKACMDCGGHFPVSTCRRRCDPCQRAHAKKCVRATYQRNKHKIAGRHKERYSEAPEKYRGYHYKHRYGVTREQVAEMYQAQGGRCAICARETPLTGVKRAELVAVDHCHSTKKVRGLLCRSCNLMLGNSGDSVKVLRAGIAYLERHE